MGTQLPLPNGGEAPRCSQMAGWIKMPLGMEVGLSPGDFVLDGDPALPSPKMGAEPLSPIFGPFLLWSNSCNTAACIKTPVGMEVGLSPRDFVLDGNPAPKFSAHVYYSYCDFVITLRKAQSLLVYSSSSFIFYAFYL